MNKLFQTRPNLTLLIEQVPFDVSKLHESEPMAAQHGMVDRGDGEKQVSRVVSIYLPWRSMGVGLVSEVGQES